MIQRRQHLGFAAETRQPIGIRGQRRGKNLDRDSTLQPAVRCLVDLAHSAGADLANHFVGAEAGTCAEHRGHEYTRPTISVRFRMRALSAADAGTTRQLTVVRANRGRFLIRPRC